MSRQKKRLLKKRLREARDSLLVCLKQGKPYGVEEHLHNFCEALTLLREHGWLWAFFQTKIDNFGSVFIAAAYHARHFELSLMLRELFELKKKPGKKVSQNGVALLLQRKNTHGRTCLDCLLGQGIQGGQAITIMLELLPPSYVAKALYQCIFEEKKEAAIGLLQNYPRDTRYGELLKHPHPNFPSHLLASAHFDFVIPCSVILQSLVEAGLESMIPDYIKVKDPSGRTALHYAAKTGSFVNFKTLLSYCEPAALLDLDNNGKTPLLLVVNYMSPSRLMLCAELVHSFNVDSHSGKSLPEILAREFDRLLTIYKEHQTLSAVLKEKLETKLKAAVSALEILSHAGTFIGRIFLDPDGHLRHMLTTIAQGKYQSILGGARLNSIFVYASYIGRKPSGTLFLGRGKKIRFELTKICGWYGSQEFSYAEEDNAVLNRMLQQISRWHCSADPYHVSLLGLFEKAILHYFSGVQDGIILGMRSDNIQAMRKLALRFYSLASLAKRAWFQLVVDQNEFRDRETNAFWRNEIESGTSVFPLSTNCDVQLDTLVNANSRLFIQGSNWLLDSSFSLRALFSLSSIVAFTTSILVLALTDKERPKAERSSPGVYAFFAGLICILSIFMLRHYFTQRTQKSRFWHALQEHIVSVKNQYERLPVGSREPAHEAIKKLTVNRGSFIEAGSALTITQNTLRFLHGKRAELLPEAPADDTVIPMPRS